MFKRTALAILAPMVLAACDPEARAVEQDFVVEETVTTQTTPYFQQQQAALAQAQNVASIYGANGQQFAAGIQQPGRILTSQAGYGQAAYGLGGQYGTQIASTAISTSQFTSGPSQSGLRADVGDRIFFTTDSSVLDQRGAAVVDQLAAWMRQYPSARIRVEGHADERGTRDYNIALGARRANSAKNALAALGIDAARISTVSYGKERPIEICSDEACYSKNRRAVTVLSMGAAG